jgi:RNA polymerase sigma factor (sigma-70 family)
VPPAEVSRPAARALRRDANELILEHLDKVATVAALLRKKLPPQIEFRELAQVGVLAMLQAEPRWDPESGEFWQFAYLRVRGAMLDFAAGFSSRIVTTAEAEGLAGRDLSTGISMRIDLERAMERLSMRERWILNRIEQGDRARQLAVALKISEARVSQIRKRIRELVEDGFVA